MIKKHLIIKATQQMVTTDKERYFRAQVIEHASKFNTNVAPANDAQPLRHYLQLQDLIRADTMFNACKSLDGLSDGLDNTQGN